MRNPHLLCFFGPEFQPLPNLNIKPSASYMHPVLDQLPKQRNYSAERGLQSFSIDGTASGWLTATQPPRASSRRLMDATKSALCWYPQWTHRKSAWLLRLNLSIVPHLGHRCEVKSGFTKITGIPRYSHLYEIICWSLPMAKD